MEQKIKIGLFGFGCVGQGLYEVLNQTQSLNAKIEKVVVKNKNKKRMLSELQYHYDPKVILEDEKINTVVELIDDADAAYGIVTKALNRGKHVVSANKKLIAEHLDELIALAEQNKVSFLYEASVCASIPIIRNLEEYYNNDSLSAIEGICNGTSNYILTQTNVGKDYDTSLEEAKELGFAESDPTLDVDGFDSKFKLLILIKHAFGLTLNPEEIFNYGVRQIKPQDVQYALEKGYRIKLFSRAEKVGNQVACFVAPHFIKSDHPGFSVDNEFNTVVVEALFSDRQHFVGKGAGSHPTASAVLSDISALSYDYKYEYKRSKLDASLSNAEDFLVKIYLGSKDKSITERFLFDQKTEVFHSSEYNYITGWIRFSKIKNIDFNNEPNLFFSLLPEPLKEVKEVLIEEYTSV